MHGIILYGLRNYVQDVHGDEIWQAVRREADADPELFLPVTTYPDEYVYEFLDATAEVTGLTREAVEFEFGRHVVSSLLGRYGVHVDGAWSALELLENLEERVSQPLRGKQLSDFTPPVIDAERRPGGGVVVTYTSDRKLCDLARGILQGVADHYEVSWSVTERTCMHDGDEQCELVVDQEEPEGAAAAAEPADGVAADRAGGTTAEPGDGGAGHRDDGAAAGPPD